MTASSSPVIERVLAAAESNAGREFGPELQEALAALVEAPPESRGAAVLALALAIPRIESPTGAGLIAVWFGASVEGGLDPGPSTGPILEALLKCSQRIETDDDGEPTADPDEALLDGMELLGQALVAHLARAGELRGQAAAEDRIVDELARVEPFSVGAMWVLELLRRQSGELVVLNVAERSGVRVRYDEIANCFHLFTLLQAALVDRWPAGELDDDVLAVARGEKQANVHDSAWWHYGQPFATEPDVVSMVFGEAEPCSIEEVDGEPVLLLWPKVLGSRSWDSGFFGPPIASSVPGVEVIEELHAEDVDHWWTRLGLSSE